MITPDSDHFGFAQWVKNNNDELLVLGDGYHFGEWAGAGINKNAHALPDKRFFLFNTSRWSDEDERPACCEVVPVLFEGELDSKVIPNLLNMLKRSETEDQELEGVVVYHHALGGYTKHTIKTPKGKWLKPKTA